MPAKAQTGVPHRSFSPSRIENHSVDWWIQLGNFDVIGSKERRHFSKFKISAFSQTLNIRRNVSQKFTEPSMETPYWFPPWSTNMAAGK